MNLYRVKVVLGGSCKTMCVQCETEADAAEIAQSKCFWGGRVVDVRWIGRAN